jgi:hypothetical protein
MGWWRGRRGCYQVNRAGFLGGEVVCFLRRQGGKLREIRDGSVIHHGAAPAVAGVDVGALPMIGCDFDTRRMCAEAMSEAGARLGEVEVWINARCRLDAPIYGEDRVRPRGRVSLWTRRRVRHLAGAIVPQLVERYTIPDRKADAASRDRSGGCRPSASRARCWLCGRARTSNSCRANSLDGGSPVES